MTKCRTCRYAPGEMRPGTADSDVNVWAPPFCEECGLNKFGNGNYKPPSRVGADRKITDTLGEIEAALLKITQIKGRATQAYLQLSELRTQAILTLARPRPGDAENGLLDGIDLTSLEWAETVARERRR